MNRRDKLLWRQVLLWKYVAYLRRQYWDLWAEIWGQLRQELSRSTLFGSPISPSRNLEVGRLLLKLKSIILSYRLRMAARLEQAVTEIYQYGGEAEESGSTRLTSALEEIIVGGSSVGDSFDSFLNGFARAVAKQVGQDLVAGAGLGVALNHLGGISPGPAEKTSSAGIVPRQWGVLEAVIEGAILAAFNQARLQSRVSGGLTEGEKVTWDAIMDTRTCGWCQELDGRSWKADTLEPVNHSTPFPGPIAHYRCRCTQTYGEERGKPGEEWLDWLQGQDMNVVAAFLGTRLAKKVRDRSLTLREFQEQWSQSLNLTHIKELDAEYLRGE